MSTATGTGYLSISEVWRALDNETGPLCPDHHQPMIPDEYDNWTSQCCGLLIPRSLKDDMEDLWEMRSHWRFKHGGVVLVLEVKPPPMQGLRRKK